MIQRFPRPSPCARRRRLRSCSASLLADLVTSHSPCAAIAQTALCDAAPSPHAAASATHNRARSTAVVNPDACAPFAAFMRYSSLCPMISSARSDYEHAIFTPKALILISHWPFAKCASTPRLISTSALPSVFEVFLKMLYRISLSSPPVPCEKHTCFVGVM